LNRQLLSQMKAGEPALYNQVNYPGRPYSCLSGV
jgi:hypothetical protein